jgi:oligopeptide/dipeptide ABC transporter ATP-binding protein
VVGVSVESSPTPTAAQRPANAPLLEIENLRVDFIRAGRTVRAVEGLSYSVVPGRTVAVIGESGSGKTVSSRAVMGLLPSYARVAGSIRYQGSELVGASERRMRDVRGREISMIFQDPARSLNPTLKIGTQIVEAIRLHRDVSKAQAADRAIELMELVRLPAARERFRQYPHQLSGGMRQRVMIAIAIAVEPKLLIADEATTALDVTTQAQIMELLRDLQARLGTAVVMISHDLGLAASFADEVVVMYAGRAVEHAPTRTLFANVRMPYTRALLGAIPRLENPSHSPLAAVPGQPPDLASQPPGCPFAPRCPEAIARCADEQPPLAVQEPEHAWACWNPCGLEARTKPETEGRRSAAG